jgi:hypothetical protein
VVRKLGGTAVTTMVAYQRQTLEGYLDFLYMAGRVVVCYKIQLLLLHRSNYLFY